MKNKSKVILLPCNSYREELVYDSLKKGLKLLGGLEALISKTKNSFKAQPSEAGRGRKGSDHSSCSGGNVRETFKRRGI